MKTEIFLENNRLDIIADDPSLLTFALDDIADFGSRQTSFSKTILLPGTANNNKLFGHIFQVGNSNAYNPALPNFGYNFNASKSAACVIFQDNIQTFKGVLRLLQIDSNDGQIEYQASVFGDLFSLNVALKGSLLSDLDFSEHNHIYNETNIQNSWDNFPGSGYYYPLIDYGNYSVNKHDWDIRTFRPALYVKEYIDKMFSVAGFRYSCALFETDRFKRLVIPNNQKALFSAELFVLQLSDPNPSEFSDTNDDDKFNYQTRHLGSNFSTSDNFVYNYIGTSAVTLEFTFSLSGTYRGAQVYYFKIIKNENILSFAESIPASESDYAFSNTYTVSISLAPGDYIRSMGSEGFDSDPNYNISFTTVSLKAKAAVGTQVPINPGDTVDLNYNLPKNIRQIDFLVSIIQLFNLYVYEDKFDNRLIHITPYIEFYGTNTSNAVDWTYKLDRSKTISLIPMSELNSKIYNFNYKEDEDYYNDLYNKRYGQVYGSHIFDSEFEFTDEDNTIELIFSSTPLVGYAGEEKVYPTIFKQSGSGTDAQEEQTDSNIRILQTKKVTGVTSWDIKDGAIVKATTISYGYAGHFDDPDAPINDLNFGALKEIFFELVSGALSATQFNVYWSAYMAEITDKDSKLLQGEFYLTPRDIFNLDFSKYISIDSVLFRLNKIEDYNMNTPANCKCSLLKVNYTQY